MQSVCVLGATGSIGDSTLDVLAQHPDSYRVFAMTAYDNVQKMFTLCSKFMPHYVVMADPDAAERLSCLTKATLPDLQILSGTEGLLQVAALTDVDIVVAAIVGAAGLESTMAAVKAGKRVLLANKESLVMAGRLLMAQATESGADLIPIDSEHNALMQCMPDNYVIGQKAQDIEGVVITASGGAFRDYPLESLATVTPEQACQHPVWSMGPKITVDSATMMNKVLEIIEAKYLFDLEPRQINVLLHPQSIVHSLVTYRDGSLIAQLGQADMRIPIASGLSWPRRVTSGVPALDLLTSDALTFASIEPERYPCIKFAYQVLAMPDSASIVLNAANEVAVAAFLGNRIRFTDIFTIADNSLIDIPQDALTSLSEILQIDAKARALAETLVYDLEKFLS